MNQNFPVALAPLAGFTDKPFRQLCKSFGADFVTTEMISSKGLFYRDKKTDSLMDFDDGERPLAVQLFGSDPQTMAYAAKKTAERSPDWIDINMGCPVPKIVGSGDGSALMTDPARAEAVIRAVVDAVSIPVSVKFRLGYDEAHINAVSFAQMCERAGAKAITLHARTRQQMYSGQADWSYIRQVKQAVNLFVWGNGDVTCPEDAIRMVEQTGCDGVMIGRGALGNPFLFAQIKSYQQTGTYQNYEKEERIRTAKEHVRAMCAHKPESVAIAQARKHLAYYLKGMNGAAYYKNQIFSAVTLQEVCDILDAFLQV